MSNSKSSSNWITAIISPTTAPHDHPNALLIHAPDLSVIACRVDHHSVAPALSYTVNHGDDVFSVLAGQQSVRLENRLTIFPP